MSDNRVSTRRRRLLAAAVGTAALLSGGITAVVTAPSATAATVHRCATAVTRCDGTLKVPLDRSDPHSPLIEVAFAWLPATDRTTPAAGTVFVNPGGPGQAIPAVDDLVLPAFQSMRTRHNILVLDPRGFGRSTPQTCPGLDSTSDASITACATKLGRYATNLHSAAFAADLDAVRAALRVPRLRLYGNSYGTVFAHAYSTRYPQHTEAVFLDGVVTTADDGYARDTPGGPIGAGIRMLAQVCGASTACRTTNRDPVTLLSSVLDKVRAGRVPGVSTFTVMRLVTWIYDPVTTRELTAALAAADTGDPAALARLSRGLTPPTNDQLTQALGPDFAAVLGYTCADYHHGFDRAATPQARRRQLADLRATTRPQAPFTPTDLPRLLRRFYADWCTNWPTPHATPVVPHDGAHPNVPVLVVNGQLDTTTPPDGAAAVAARYPRARYATIPFGDHGSSFGGIGPYSTCVNRLMRTFLTTPARPLTLPACDGEMLRPLGRFPRIMRDVAPATVAGTVTTRRLVTAAHATAVDALARLAPPTTAEPGTRPGLRGGTITYRTVTTLALTRTRYVTDLAVTGTVRIDKKNRATADLTVTGAGGRHRLRLTWHAWRGEDTTAITGHLDGHAVRGQAPLT